MSPLSKYVLLLALFSLLTYIVLIIIPTSNSLLKLVSVGYMWTPTLATLITLKESRSLKAILGTFKLKYYALGAFLPLLHLLVTRTIFSSYWIDPSDVLLLIKGEQVNTLMLIAEGLLFGCTVNAVIALGEEIGWRGFLYSQLSGGRFRKSVIIGIIWALWHWPLIALGYLNFPTSKLFGLPAFAITLIPMTYVMLALREREGVYSTSAFHGVVNGLLGLEYLALFQLPDWLRPPAGLGGAIGWIVLAITIKLIEKVDLSISWSRGLRAQREQ